MRTIDTRGQNLYSPLIPAIKAMCEAGKGEEQGIGFREIYDGEEMLVQFCK